MKNIKILMVEDDEVTAKYMEEYLENCNFTVSSVNTITDGISYMKQNRYDVLLLDLNMPDFSGFDLLKNIKNSISLPIIVISAYSDTQTKVQAFKYGVSDYLVKPVDLEELEARIWSLVGRYSEIKTQFEKNIFEIDGLNILFEQAILNLTNVEFQILSTLIKNKKQTIKREDLLKSLSTISSPRSLDNHIKNIRIKITDDGNKPVYLQTEYGVGYKLVY